MERDLTDNDYVLVDGAAWFTVREFSIRIRDCGGHLAIAVYPKGNEMEEAIDTLTVFYEE
jgi:hypothetical protein